MKTTSLKLSKALANIGVRVESEFEWTRPKDLGEFVVWHYEKYNQTRFGDGWDIVPAYTLQELREVLIEVGKKISEEDELMPPEMWEHHFSKICSLYAQDGNLGEDSEVEAYILSIIK